MLEKPNNYETKESTKEISQIEETKESVKTALESEDIIKSYLIQLEEVKDSLLYKKLYIEVQKVKDTDYFKQLCVSGYNKGLRDVDYLFYYNPKEGK